MKPDPALQRLGLSLNDVQTWVWKQRVQANATQPSRPTTAPARAYRSPRLVNTCYLDGEQQRAKKAVLHANEAVIVGMVMQGRMTVLEIALAFGVTDQAIRNRVQKYGIRTRQPAPTVGPGLWRWLEVSGQQFDAVPAPHVPTGCGVEVLECDV